MSVGGVKVKFVKSKADGVLRESYTVRPAMSSSASSKMMTRHAAGALVEVGRLHESTGA